MNTNQIITAFKDAGWSGILYRNVNNALNQKKNIKPLWCGYNNQFRLVSPAVCKWHKSKNDPQCEGCSLKQSV